MSKCYAIYGSNGLGVMSDWDQVLKVKKYFQSVHYKRFEDFYLAEKYAIDGFEAHVCTTQNNECVAPKKLKLNELIFAKHLPRNIFEKKCYS